MKKRVYFFAAVASYFILLIATIPASLITDTIKNNNTATIHGTSGSIWNGKAYIILTGDNIELKNTEWSFSLWKVLIGKISIKINSQYLDNDISAEIGTSFLGRYFVNNLKATIPAQQATQLANIPLVQLSGEINFNIEHAQWKQGELPLATGVINWNNAEVTVADTASLGNVSITLSESEQQLLNADIKNQGGDIKVNGTAELVAEADYAVNIKLLPTASASDNIKQSLGLFAKKQNNGEYLLNYSGTLSQLGLI
ncbi:MAG: type II secretion system protein N [Gammaproteobacteria bacterium]